MARKNNAKYSEKYCQMLIDHMAAGYSFETFAPKIGVSRKTIFNWAKKHKAFGEAKIEAFDHCMLFWERMGISGSAGRLPGFNCAAWIFQMKNRFKWRSEPRLGDDDDDANVKIELAYAPGK